MGKRLFSFAAAALAASTSARAEFPWSSVDNGKWTETARSLAPSMRSFDAYWGQLSASCPEPMTVQLGGKHAMLVAPNHNMTMQDLENGESARKSFLRNVLTRLRAVDLNKLNPDDPCHQNIKRTIQLAEDINKLFVTPGGYAKKTVPLNRSREMQEKTDELMRDFERSRILMTEATCTATHKVNWEKNLRKEEGFSQTVSGSPLGDEPLNDPSSDYARVSVAAGDAGLFKKIFFNKNLPPPCMAEYRKAENVLDALKEHLSKEGDAAYQAKVKAEFAANPENSSPSPCIAYAFDASSSMGHDFNGGSGDKGKNTRMNAAHANFSAFLKAKKFVENEKASLIVFGQGKLDPMMDSCHQAGTLVSLGDALSNKQNVHDRAMALQPSDNTPLALGVLRAEESLSKCKGPHKVIIITDGGGGFGNDACRHEFCQGIKKLKQKGIEVALDFINLGNVKIDGLLANEVNCVKGLSLDTKVSLSSTSTGAELLKALKNVEPLQATPGALHRTPPDEDLNGSLLPQVQQHSFAQIFAGGKAGPAAGDKDDPDPEHQAAMSKKQSMTVPQPTAVSAPVTAVADAAVQEMRPISIEPYRNGKPVDPKNSDLMALEQKLIQRNYNGIDADSRLDRMDTFVFGEAMKGSQSNRLANLLVAAGLGEGAFAPSEPPPAPAPAPVPVVAASTPVEVVEVPPPLPSQEVTHATNATDPVSVPAPAIEPAPIVVAPAPVAIETPIEIPAPREVPAEIHSQIQDKPFDLTKPDSMKFGTYEGTSNNEPCHVIVKPSGNWYSRKVPMFQATVFSDRDLDKKCLERNKARSNDLIAKHANILMGCALSSGKFSQISFGQPEDASFAARSGLLLKNQAKLRDLSVFYASHRAVPPYVRHSTLDSKNNFSALVDDLSYRFANEGDEGLKHRYINARGDVVRRVTGYEKIALTKRRTGVSGSLVGQMLSNLTISSLGSQSFKGDLDRASYDRWKQGDAKEHFSVVNARSCENLKWVPGSDQLRGDGTPNATTPATNH